MFFEKEIVNAKGNIKQTWSLINEATGKNKVTNDKNINCVGSNKSTLSYDEKEIANEFNNYFCNVGKNISDKLIEKGFM